MEPEAGVDASQECTEAAYFGIDVLRQTKDMGVVLRKRARAHQAVQRTRGFMAVTRAELAEP